jgi:hypothetical protein
MKKLLFGAAALGVSCFAIDSQSLTVMPTGNVSIVLSGQGTIVASATQISYSKLRAAGAGTVAPSWVQQPLTVSAALPSSTTYIVQFGTETASTLSAVTLHQGTSPANGLVPGPALPLTATFHRTPGTAVDWKTWAATTVKALSLKFNGRTISAPSCNAGSYGLGLNPDGTIDESLMVFCSAIGTSFPTMTGATGLELGFGNIFLHTLVTWTVGGVSCTGTNGVIVDYLLDKGAEQLTLNLASAT